MRAIAWWRANPLLGGKVADGAVSSGAGCVPVSVLAEPSAAAHGIQGAAHGRRGRGADQDRS